jgi:hypothetical protein
MARVWLGLALCVVCSLPVVCRAQNVAQGALLSTVEPRYGSMAGGTEISLYGSGFARNGLEGSTTVFVGNQECEVNLYKSTDTRVCGDARVTCLRDWGVADW